MHVALLMIENFGPYRGKHELELGPQAYAVVARYESDPDRSNYAGKTSLLEAIRFALHGTHRERLEDEWITNGERQGSVGLKLGGRGGDGRTIWRTRERGKATKLTAEDGDVRAEQGEAQRLIDQWLGLSEGDFATCHAAQGQAAAFVCGDPAARTTMVSAWLRLDRLEACAASAASELKVAEKNREGASYQLHAVRGGILSALGMDGALPSPEHQRAREEQMVASVADLDEEIARAKRQKEASQQRFRDAYDREQLERQKREYDDVCARGAAAGQKLKLTAAMKWDAEEDVMRREVEARGLQIQAKHRVDQKRQLASKTGFDGRCPLVDIECPARATIVGMRDEHDAALKDAVKAFGEADGTLRDASMELAHVRGHKVQLREEQAEYARLRERAVALVPSVKKLEAMGPTPPAEQEALLDHDALVARRAQLAGRLAELERFRPLEAGMAADVEARVVEIGMLREAAAVFGRQGAQRRVAAAALGEIEAGANELLQIAGVDLEVGLEWERQGTGIASECDACGWAYPASAKVKVCSGCGAARGPKMVRQLDVVRSRVSGAADDLAGVALSLSAAGWLRGERGAQWAVAMLDECFAHCDKANRRAVAQHFGAMLGASGFEQCLVVSHDEATASALSGRIVVVSDGVHARLELA